MSLFQYCWSLIYLIGSLYSYYKYQKEGKNEESLGCSYYTTYVEKKYYLILVSLFQHDTILYLIMDILTFFLVDISFSQNENKVKSSSIALLLITTVITVLIYFATIQRIQEERTATDMDQRNFRFYGIYHFGLVSLPLLPVSSTFHRFLKLVLLLGYIFKEKRFSVIIPFTFILILIFPLLPVLISSYWQFWISFFILSFCILDFFNHLNSTVLPTSDTQHIPTHFQEVQNIRM